MNSKRYRVVLFDLDGTLYRGEEAIPNAVRAVERAHEAGVVVRYLTNNSSRTCAFYAEKLRRLGFQANESEIFTSASASAAHLRLEGFTTCFVFGAAGLAQTLKESGIQVVNTDCSGDICCTSPQAQAVVVGICPNLTYGLLDAAMQQIFGGAEFVASNADATFPLEAGRLSPGAGSMVAALCACSGRKPFVVGKPNPFMVVQALAGTGAGPAESLVVGDRLDTDVEAGRRAGCDTFLVLTGVEREAPKGQWFGGDLSTLAF